MSVSIGGYGGTKLGQTCGTPAATAAAYQQVVSKYALKAIDFDLEEPEYENAAAVHNELGAAQILQQNNPGLYVSVTTAGTAAGTGWFGQQMLNDAKSLGFTPNNYSIMPFDGGFNGAASQTSALEAFHAHPDDHVRLGQRHRLRPRGRVDDERPQRRRRVLPPGRLPDRAGLRDRATTWPGTRTGRSTATGSAPTRTRARPPVRAAACPRAAWDFTKYTAQFAGATPPTSPPTTRRRRRPARRHVHRAGLERRPPCTPAGSSVSYNGHTWKAQWWTQGETPGAAQVWLDQGACSGSGGGGGTPSCSAPAWSPTTAYNGQAVVTYNGHSWTAKWWTQGDIPGNNGQSVWTDNGPC